MKRLSKRVLISFALTALLALPLAGRSGELNPGPAALIPANALAVIQVNEIRASADHLKTFLDTVGQGTVALRRGQKELKHDLGFDPFAAGSLSSRGINEQGSAAFALIPEPGKHTRYFPAALVQVSDQTAFVRFLSDQIKRRTLVRPCRKEKEGITRLGCGGHALFVAFKSSYALISPSRSALSALLKVSEAESLAQSKEYQTMLARLFKAQDLIAYLPPAGLELARQDAEKNEGHHPPPPTLLKMARTLSEAGAVVAISADGLDAHYAALLRNDDWAESLMPSSREAGGILGRLQGSAPALAETPLDATGVWTLIRQIVSEDKHAEKHFRHHLKVANKKLGIDLEKDWIAQLKGDPVVLAYDLGGSKKPPDVLVAVEAKDPQALAQSLDKMAGHFQHGRLWKKQEIQGHPVYIGRHHHPLAAAVVGDYLLVASSPARMEQTIKNLNGQGPTVLDQVANPEVKDRLKDPRVAVVYVTKDSLNSALSELSRKRLRPLKDLALVAGRFDQAWASKDYPAAKGEVTGEARVQFKP